MSEANRVIVRYIDEGGSYGVTPTTGAWQVARFTGESLTATPNTVVSSEIRSDRMDSDMPKVGLTVGGGLDIELSPTTYDDFLESAMCDTWTLDVLKIGTEDSSYSIEKEFADLSKFISFTGMRVGQMSLSMAYGSIITGSIQFAGNGAATADTTIVGGGSTEDPATTTEVMNASSDIGSVKIDGVETSICINSLNIDINNNLREINCIKSEAPVDQKKGTASVTGSVEMYLSADSFAQYGNALTNTSIELEYTVTDGTNSYTFLLPNVKLQGDAPQAGSKDSDVFFTANFTALFDNTESTSLKVTRV